MIRLTLSGYVHSMFCNKSLLYLSCTGGGRIMSVSKPTWRQMTSPDVLIVFWTCLSNYLACPLCSVRALKLLILTSRILAGNTLAVSRFVVFGSTSCLCTSPHAPRLGEQKHSRSPPITTGRTGLDVGLSPRQAYVKLWGNERFGWLSLRCAGMHLYNQQRGLVPF